MHSDLTINLLDQETTLVGNQLRIFRSTTCNSFNTRELRREASARERREAKAKVEGTSKPKRGKSSKSKGKLSKSKGKASETTQADNDVNPKDRDTGAISRKARTLNLNTYKVHALGDYADTIRKYGTTDSYSTELVLYLSTFF